MKELADLTIEQLNKGNVEEFVKELAAVLMALHISSLEGADEDEEYKYIAPDNNIVLTIRSAKEGDEE